MTEKRSATIFLAFFAVWVAIFGFLPSTDAGGGPQNLALLVNPNDTDSLRIANEYIHLRKIPPANVIYLPEVPEKSVIPVEQFRKKILGPALKTLEKRHVAGQIDYLIYSTGFPHAVNVKSDIKGKKLPKILSQPASITGLTYLYLFALAQNPNYMSLNANQYMRKTRLGPMRSGRRNWNCKKHLNACEKRKKPPRKKRKRKRPEGQKQKRHKQR
ncbi:MAG: hypothetical protein ACLFWL_05545 [Candidatus Brocadiia bacterium]